MDPNDFESLNPEEQAKIFHKSSFREKGELFLHSHNPASLTRSLSREELYLLTREMDIDERSEVLRYANLPQLFFVADIDCWKKDRMEGKSFIQWMETLLAAGEDQLVAWLTQMDYEAVVSGFQHIIEVLKPDHEWTADEVLGDRPYFTIDQMYYIVVNEENMDTVKRALQILFERSRGRYFALLEGVMSEVEDQLEEEAYQRREMRLSERGFPDFETAQRIYRPITREEFKTFARPKQTAVKEEPAELLPNYMLLWSEERLFLDDVLQSFRDDHSGIREQLEEELAWLSNKVIACAGIDFSSEKKVRKGIERARFMINIGLEELSGRDLNQARKIVSEYWLEAVSRWGVTQSLALKDEAKALVKKYWDNSQVDFLNFLNPPYDVTMTGILRAIPEYYDDSLKSEDKYRDFKNLDDIERINRAIRQTGVLHSLFHGKFKKFFTKAKEDAAAQGRELNDLLFLGTIFSQWILKEKMIYEALKPAEIARLLEKGFSGHVLSKELKESFSGELLDAPSRALCLPFLALFFLQFQEGMNQALKEPEESPIFLTAPAPKKTPSRPRKK